MKIDDIAILTEINIKRNITGEKFPICLSNNNARHLCEVIEDVFLNLENADEFIFHNIDDIDPLNQRILEERRVLPENILAKSWQALVVHNDGMLATTVNIEDHINILSFSRGFNVSDAYLKAAELEATLSDRIDFAYDEELGFLTNDIYSIGSGLQMTLLCSLPGLVITRKIDSIIEKISIAGFKFSGYYTTNSKLSVGNLYLISSISSAGSSIQEQVQHIETQMKFLIDAEKKARIEILEIFSEELIDMMIRSILIAKYAIFISLKEATDILFKIKLGVDLNMVESISNEELNNLLYKIQIGHIAFDLANKNNLNTADFKITEKILDKERAKMFNLVFKNTKLKEATNG